VKSGRVRSELPDGRSSTLRQKAPVEVHGASLQQVRPQSPQERTPSEELPDQEPTGLNPGGSGAGEH